MENLLNFILSGKEREKIFNFNRPYSYILIKKIVFPQLIGRPDEWSPVLQKLNPQLIIKCEADNGASYSSEVNLQSFISPFHYQPVIDFQNSFIIPQQHSMISFPPSGTTAIPNLPFYKRAIITLTYTGIESTPLNVSVFYEKNQGVY